MYGDLSIEFSARIHYLTSFFFSPINLSLFHKVSFVGEPKSKTISVICYILVCMLISRIFR